MILPLNTTRSLSYIVFSGPARLHDPVGDSRLYASNSVSWTCARGFVYLLYPRWTRVLNLRRPLSSKLHFLPPQHHDSYMPKLYTTGEPHKALGAWHTDGHFISPKHSSGGGCTHELCCRANVTFNSMLLLELGSFRTGRVSLARFSFITGIDHDLINPISCARQSIIVGRIPPSLSY